MRRTTPRSMVLSFLLPLLIAAAPALAAPGDHVWSRGFDAEMLADVTTSGEVVSAGIFYGSVDFGGGLLETSTPFGGEMYVVKFDAAGQHQYSFAIGGGQNMRVDAVRADGAGGVYVMGRVFSGTVDFGGGPLVASTSFFVVRYDASGNHVFSNFYGDVEIADAEADAQGLLIAGATRSTADFGGGPLTTAGNTDALVVRLDGTGAHVFSAIYGGASSEYARAVGTDASGAPVLAMQIVAPTDFGGGVLTPAGYALVLVELDANGAHVRSTLIDGSFTSGATFNMHLDVDDAGDFVLAGELHGGADFGGGTIYTAANTDVFVATFDTDGVHQFSQSYGSSSFQVVNSVALTPEGSIVLSGNFVNSIDFGGGPLSAGASIPALFFARLSRTGTHESSAQIGPGFALSTRVAASGVTLLNASATPDLDLGGGPLGPYYSFLGVLEGGATSTPAPAAPLRILGGLTNRPNPFNPSTVIEFDLHREARVTLSIVDARGRVVLLDHLGSRAAGRHAVRWDGRDAHGVAVGSGVYTVWVRAGDEATTRRAVLVE